MSVRAFRARYDAVIVGSGPNGLAAAITLALAGRSVLVREGASAIGGGLRSMALTLPGAVHDVCSAVHPLAIGSPFFRTLPLPEFGLEWVHAGVPLAHPFDDTPAAVLARDVDETAAGFGTDADAYRALVGPLLSDWPVLAPAILQPLRIPRHPLVMARFGMSALRAAAPLVRSRFHTPGARGLLAGLAAHSMLPLGRIPTMAIALVLAVAGHAEGWPFPRGGAQRLAEALAAYLRSKGGEIITGAPVASLAELEPARAVLLDVTPAQLVRIAGDALPSRARRALLRYRYGPGVCKVDWLIEGPIPWSDTRCARAGTVHLGGTLDEIVVAEDAPWRGEHAERPFVLLTQPSVFDPSRAPNGRQAVWAYCHTPHGSTTDVHARIEAQVERFAPGFRDRVVARHVMTAGELEAHNPNLVGGDVGGGANTLLQLFRRPTSAWHPYRTAIPHVYLCSASTPPGGGVHGMCGHHAALAVLRDDG
ncbi:MAG TPA: NAD(P)/FAD-dependent oxidoreductase [Gemmatimonadaceae bacterium]|nr:NAD(P)/FAD-dependent oxidoreductase [Gemmatimonadaceae bacterium]